MSQLALIYNHKSGFQREMTAVQFEQAFAGNPKRGIEPTNPEELVNLSIINQRLGVTMGFRRSHFRNGSDALVRASFVLPKGYGQDGHLYRHDYRQDDSLKEAVQNGRRILIRLNNNFDPVRFDWKKMREPEGQGFSQWVSSGQDDFFAVPAATAQDVATILRDIKDTAKDAGLEGVSKNISFLHNGIVMPYHAVVIRRQQSQSLRGLFNGLESAAIGVNASVNGYRGSQIGFPRLVEFEPTIKTRSDNVVLGNHIKADTGMPYLSQITCPTLENGKADVETYRHLKDMLKDHQSIWILAVPYAKPYSASHDQFKMLRWHIGNQFAQTLPVNDNKQGGAQPNVGTTAEQYREASQHHTPT